MLKLICYSLSSCYFLKITGYVGKRSTSVTCILNRTGQSYEHNLNQWSTVLIKQIVAMQQESSTLWRKRAEANKLKKSFSWIPFRKIKKPSVTIFLSVDHNSMAELLTRSDCVGISRVQWLDLMMICCGMALKRMDR
jgi:hypothetical protein